MATLVATEEFPHNIVLAPKVPAAAIRKESVLSNGIKIVSNDLDSAVNIKRIVSYLNFQKIFKLPSIKTSRLSSSAFLSHVGALWRH